MKMSMIFFLVLTILLVGITEADERHRNNNNEQHHQQHNHGENGKSSSRNDNGTGGKNVKRLFGISAWGLIGLIMAAIILSTFGYYAFVFYPFLCKKERNYDMIQLTNVV